jgi:hypothetical protein
MPYRFVDEEAKENPQVNESESNFRSQTRVAPQKPQGNKFRFVEEEAPTTKKISSNPFAVPEVSAEEYKNMSLQERIAYSKALEREQQYERSKSFTKNLASGLTLGATENIEALRPEEGEEPISGFAGQATGSLLPIGLAAKAVGAGIKGAGLVYQHGPKILQYLSKIVHGFGTGGLYETGKQVVNVASGKEFEPAEIAKTGVLFGTGEAIIKAFGDVGRKFLKFSPQHQAQILEKGIIPEDLPKSQYETAEQMLDLIKGRSRNFPEFPPGGGPPPPGAPPGAPPPPLAGRVTPGGEDLGLRPAPGRENTHLADQVGNIFSQNRFYNTTQGGHAFRHEIMAIDENVYRGVNELYRISRELNSQIDEIHPNLVNRLQNRITELRAIPEPSDVQRRLLRASENILERLIETGDNGEIIDYLPINNQVLIDQVQSLRQIIDYDFAHGNTKNIFRPLINDLQDSALRAAENSGSPEAADAMNEARNAYRMWVEAFDNDYVRPFRDASNQDYSKLFKSALDLDENNMLRRILNTTPRGQQLINASTRDIVEKNLGKFFENPRDVNPREFDKALRELEAVITPEQSQQIRELFRQASERPSFRAVPRAPRAPTNEEVIAGKYLDKKPEDIQKMMNSRSGIRELRRDFQGSEQKRELFDRLSKQKMRSILREGNIEKEFTGDDLYRFLNKESNYEIFSEILGETETESLRLAAKQIGKEQVKSEIRKRRLSKIANKMVALKTFELLLGIL